jgi:hypothetical protein
VPGEAEVCGSSPSFTGIFMSATTTSGHQGERGRPVWGSAEALDNLAEEFLH